MIVGRRRDDRENNESASLELIKARDPNRIMQQALVRACLLWSKVLLMIDSQSTLKTRGYLRSSLAPCLCSWLLAMLLALLSNGVEHLWKGLTLLRFVCNVNT